MKPLKLILDYTIRAKDKQETGAWEDPKLYETTLKSYYSNGEHCSTFPEKRNPDAGRKAAKTFMKYCYCSFEDKTK